MAVWKIRDISRDTPPTSFRVAYYVTKKCLELAEKLGKPINKLTLAEFQSVNKYIGPDVYDVFDLKKAMERRNIVGAPGTKQVKKQLARWHKILNMEEDNDDLSDKYADLKRRYLAPAQSFRECHHLVGEIYLAAEKEKLPLDEFVRKFISKKVADEVFNLENYDKRRKHVWQTEWQFEDSKWRNEFKAFQKQLKRLKKWQQKQT